MPPDQFPADRQPQPQAVLALAGLADLLKTAEHPLLIFRRDADAGIPHADQHRAGIGAGFAGIQRDRSLAGVLDGVGQKIGHHLLDAHRIAEHLRQIRVHIQAELHLLRPGDRTVDLVLLQKKFFQIDTGR